MNNNHDETKNKYDKIIEIIKICIIVLIVLLFVCIVIAFFSKPKKTISIDANSPSDIFIVPIPNF